MTRRILFPVVVTLAGVLVTALLALLWGFGTQSGTRALWGLASGAVAGLEAESVEGRLAGPLDLRGLRYSDDYRALEIGSVTLDWRPWRLLSGELILDRLHVSDVDYRQVRPSPPPEKEEPFEIPERFSLPVDLDLRDVSVESLAYRASPEAEPVVVDRADLAATFRGNDLALPRLSVRGPLFWVEANAAAVTRGD